MLTLEEVLADPVNLNYFKRFCMSEMSTENLLFWLEVQEYRSIKAPDYRGFVARKVYRKYIKQGAPQQIGLGQAAVDEIRAAIEHGSSADGGASRGAVYSAALFDVVQASVMSTMRMDIFPRFIESPDYRALQALHSDDRHVVGIRDFDLHRFLGAGGFGMVLLARQRESKRMYAVKVIDKRILISQNQTHSIFREKEVLASVEHPFIVPLRFAFQTEDHLCFVLDYIAGGNMYSDLLRGPYTHARAVFYAAQIVLATHHLHELDILYRDLKPDNVLLTLDGYVKLADMGAARGVAENGSISINNGSTTSCDKTAKAGAPTLRRRMTITGTHGYRAPEVYDRDYGKEADWWNVGILIIEMLTAENPFRGSNRKESEQLTKHKPLALPSYIQPDACDLASRLLQRDRSRRCGCGERGVAEVYEHPFFASIDWEGLLAMEVRPPFEPDMDTTPPARQQIPKAYEGSELDYFCQMVDYLKTSLSMRNSFPLAAHDQRAFDGFDHVSYQVFEQELRESQVDDSNPFGF
ncbi:hypothetical protein EMIHUDRAFT_444936 [Emiliania huxleyi CCMP1516]|nr:hypothetical protein EMIHUDRAFT_444936 [Emiliania huxleyi CCMP1516]EOD19245.1 hypothetical protein EMIHUDRAFT_444936 [Emiliania huxleyi CCMP1516]|eukprot:XP_005771674.1 hypothetical protein EMIHUDRAFT_444936 [Emiliania huxleyi CCMP1516]